MTPIRSLLSTSTAFFAVTVGACSDGGDITITTQGLQASGAASGGGDTETPAPAGSLQGAVSADSDLPAASPARGFAVVNSDYSTYSVSLLDSSGGVRNASLISSGSTTAGLSAPFSDVVMPSSTVLGSELVIINRLPASFLTWVDLNTLSVRAQLNVGTGFSSNPHDYVSLSPTKAYVVRHDPNFDAGREAFDGGNDILIVDPSQPAITGRIDLMPVLKGAEPGLYPRATRSVVAGGLVRVLALGLDEFYDRSTDSRVLTVDPTTDAITDVLVLRGLQNCGQLSLSPDGNEIAVGCTGPFGADPALGFPSSGIVLLSVDDTLEETRRWAASELGGETINSVAYAGDDSLVFTSYGRYNDDYSAMLAPDRARRLDLQTGRIDPDALRQSEGSPYVLGEIRCEPSAATCVLADAETMGGVVVRFDIDAEGQLQQQGSVTLEAGVGIPPRSISRY